MTSANAKFFFVVSYDTETGEFDLDYQAQQEFTKGKPVLENSSHYRALSEWEWERDETPYNRAGDDLFRLIGELNDARKNFRPPSLQ